MSQVGEKYVFISRSTQQGTDRFRTLIGAFYGGARATRRQGRSKEEANLVKKIANFYSKKRIALKRVAATASPAGRAALIKRYHDIQRNRREKPSTALVFPRGTIHRAQYGSWWNRRRDDGSRVEAQILWFGGETRISRRFGREEENFLPLY